MALNFGAIFGSLDLDLSKWTKALERAYREGDRTAAKTVGSWTKAGNQSGGGFVDAVNKAIVALPASMSSIPTKSIDDFDRAGAKAGAGFAGSVSQQVARLDQALYGPAKGVDSVYRRAGGQAGDGFAAGVDRGVQSIDDSIEQQALNAGASPAFYRAGREAGDSFTDGVDATAGSSGGGGIEGVLGGAMAGAKGGLVGVAAAVGALVGAGFVKAITDGMDLQQIEDELVAGLALSGPRAEQIGGLVGRLYADGFGESFEQIADTVNDVFEKGVLPRDAIASEVQGASELLLNMSKILKIDVGEAAIAVGSIMKNGLAPDVRTAADAIVHGFQNGANAGEDLIDTLQEYAPHFAALGMDANEAMGFLIQGMQAGARNTDQLGDAVKEFTILARGELSTVERKVGDVAGALNRVESASRSLKDTENDHLRVIKAANEARGEQMKLMRDLAEQAVDSAHDVEGAEIDLARAQERLAEVNADPTASTLDKREAELAVRRSMNALDDQKRALADVTGARNTANAEGVAGSEKVRQADFEVMASAQRVADATDELRQARVALGNSYGTEVRKLTPLGEAYRRLGIDGVWAQSEIAKGGDAAGAVFDLVADRINLVSDPLERFNLRLQFFGTKAEDLGPVMDAMDPSAVGLAMVGAAGAADRLSEAARNLNSFLDRLQRGGIMKIIDALNWLGELLPFVGGVAALAANRMREAWEKIGPVVMGVYHAIQWAWDKFSGFLGWLDGIRTRIDSAVTGAWDGLRNGFEGVMNGIIGAWNRFARTFSWDGIKIPGLGQVGGWTLPTFRPLQFHEGGEVPGRRGQEVPAVLLAGERVRTAAQAANDDMWRAVGQAALADLAGVGRQIAASTINTTNTVVNQTFPITVKFDGPVTRDGAQFVKDSIADGVRRGVIQSRTVPDGQRGSVRVVNV